MKSADHPAGGMLLRLKNGRMEVAAEKLPGSPPRFEVHTSNARILVFGTHFRVLANPEKRMATCEIFEGTAEVRDTGNLGTVTVPEGSGTRVLDGHPPSAPSELLPAPRLWKGVRMWIRRPIQLNFTRLQGATEYLVTVARNADFSSIVSETLFRSNVIDLSELANGPYFLKLRGIDKLGFEGRETTADLVLNFEEPKAPSGWALPR